MLEIKCDCGYKFTDEEVIEVFPQARLINGTARPTEDLKCPICELKDTLSAHKYDNMFPYIMEQLGLENGQEFFLLYEKSNNLAGSPAYRFRVQNHYFQIQYDDGSWSGVNQKWIETILRGEYSVMKV